LLGIIIGAATKDIAVWLSVGVGCVLAVEAGIGAVLDSRRK